MTAGEGARLRWPPASQRKYSIVRKGIGTLEVMVTKTKKVGLHHYCSLTTMPHYTGCSGTAAKVRDVGKATSRG